MLTCVNKYDMLSSRSVREVVAAASSAMRSWLLRKAWVCRDSIHHLKNELVWSKLVVYQIVYSGRED